MSGTRLHQNSTPAHERGQKLTSHISLPQLNKDHERRVRHQPSFPSRDPPFPVPSQASALSRHGAQLPRCAPPMPSPVPRSPSLADNHYVSSPESIFSPVRGGPISPQIQHAPLNPALLSSRSPGLPDRPPRGVESSLSTAREKLSLGGSSLRNGSAHLHEHDEDRKAAGADSQQRKRFSRMKVDEKEMPRGRNCGGRSPRQVVSERSDRMPGRPPDSMRELSAHGQKQTNRDAASPGGLPRSRNFPAANGQSHLRHKSETSTSSSSSGSSSLFAMGLEFPLPPMSGDYGNFLSVEETEAVKEFLRVWGTHNGIATSSISSTSSGPIFSSKSKERTEKGSRSVIREDESDEYSWEAEGNSSDLDVDIEERDSMRCDELMKEVSELVGIDDDKQGEKHAEREVLQSADKPQIQAQIAPNLGFPFRGRKSRTESPDVPKSVSDNVFQESPAVPVKYNQSGAANVPGRRQVLTQKLMEHGQGALPHSTLFPSSSSTGVSSAASTVPSGKAGESHFPTPAPMHRLRTSASCQSPLATRSGAADARHDSRSRTMSHIQGSSPRQPKRRWGQVLDLGEPVNPGSLSTPVRPRDGVPATPPNRSSALDRLELSVEKLKVHGSDHQQSTPPVSFSTRRGLDAARPTVPSPKIVSPSPLPLSSPVVNSGNRSTSLQSMSIPPSLPSPASYTSLSDSKLFGSPFLLRPLSAGLSRPGTPKYFDVPIKSPQDLHSPSLPESVQNSESMRSFMDMDADQGPNQSAPRRLSLLSSVNSEKVKRLAKAAARVSNGILGWGKGLASPGHD